MELSTISDEGVEKVNINKLKVYHHNPPTNVIITIVIVIQDLIEKLDVGIEIKPNLIFHLNCIPNQRIYLGLTQNLEKYLMKMTLNGLERKIQKVAYQECLKT